MKKFTEQEIHTYTTRNNVVAPIHKPKHVAIYNNGDETTKLDKDFTKIKFPEEILSENSIEYDEGEFTIKQGGWINIRSHITCEVIKGHARQASHGIFINDELIQGSQVYSYHCRIGKHGNGANTANLEYIIFANDNDIIDIRSRDLSNESLQTLAYACNIIIERV